SWIKARHELDQKHERVGLFPRPVKSLARVPMSHVEQLLVSRFCSGLVSMKKTILLVEDSKIQRVACEKILHSAGYLVLYAPDGEEALRLAQESVPDLILLDLLLPGIGGEEVLYALKRSARTEGIPVIVLSSLPATKSIELMA